MRQNPNYLLHLIAIGRLSPAEAERLIQAWNEGRETAWALAACIVISFLAELKTQHWLPAVLQSIHSLLSGSFISAQHALPLLTGVIGGIQ
jgi:CHASE2 domain-containing sensor protein